jgi:HlyD family secretion protein
MVDPATRLFTLADLSQPYAYVYVPQPKIAGLSLGAKVTGYLPEMRMKEFAGTIVQIGDEAEFTPKNVQTRDERTRLVYAVKVEFANPQEVLKPGMSIEVKLPES